MELWIWLVFAAQLINALVVLFDKYLVTSSAISKPVVYAFYVSLLSGVAIVVAPFASVPSAEIILLSLAAALSYIISILFLYHSLKVSDASDVMPVVGSSAAIATFILGFYILGTRLTPNFMWGFVLLVIGMALISHFRFSKRNLLYVVASGVLFGISSIFIKMIFLQTDFLNGFFWTRMANVVMALLLLAWPAHLTMIHSHIKEAPKKIGLWVIGNKTLAGVAFLLILVGIKLGNVSLVNALAGLQFVFLLMFTVFFGHKTPKEFGEETNDKEIVQKAVAIILVVIGFFILFLPQQ